MTFSEQLQQQRERVERRIADVQIRQRETFAENYARMEAATANDPQDDEEECSDLG